MGSAITRLTCAAAVLACAVACAPKNARPATVATPTTPAPAPAPPSTAAAADEFPAGPGRQILTNACTTCHSLREVTKFRGFYVRQQWRDVVLTMVDYGAPVSDKEVEVLTDYLTQHLGKK
jgi:cytochrome c5